MNARTRIKICGLRTERDVIAAVEAGADALGFVFVQSSPRFITPDAAAELVCLLPPLVEAVGLFADHEATDICAMAGDACIQMVQLHGREDRRCVERVREEFAVIKGIRFEAATVDPWTTSQDIDMLLVDGSEGGRGTALDWTALAAQRDLIKVPLVLAGGLTAGNVAEAISTVRPYAVDVSSGVESERGIKDSGQIRAFCRAVRNADQQRAD